MSFKSIIMAVAASFFLINSTTFAATIIPEPYAFSLDRFTIQVENPPISTVVDEFNDGVLDPALWEVYDPTVVESGEVVTFQSPGEVVKVTPNIYSSWSYIGSKFSMTNDMGSFVGTSTWLPIVPQSNQFYGMGLSLQDPLTGKEGQEIGISIINLEDPVILGADFFDIPPGLGIWFSRRTESDKLQQSQFVPIDESFITGDIVLYLGFDDVTQSFNAGFSLDGGATVQEPFMPDVTGPTSFGNWSFGAESLIAVSEPHSFSLFCLALMGLFWVQRRKYLNC